MNNIYNDAFLYRRIVIKNKKNHSIKDFKQKSKYKINTNTFTKIKMEFEVPYCYDELEINNERKGWSVLQCGIIFNDPKNMLKHGHVEIKNVCLMDVGAIQQAEMPPLEHNTTMFSYNDLPNHLETKVAQLETKVAELESMLNYNIENFSKKLDQLTNEPIQPVNDLWEPIYDTEGNLYYLNKSTNESAWDLPPGAKISNKKTVPPLPPRSTSPITVSGDTADIDDDDYLTEHFNNEIVPDLFTLVNPRSKHSTDFLSDNHTHAKVHPSVSDIMGSSMRLTEVEVYEPPSPTKSLSPKKSKKSNKLIEPSYEEQIRRALIESMASG